MRILLFDWYAGGHHELYLAEFTRALAPRHSVVAAGSGPGAAAAAAAGAEALVLEEPMALADTSGRFGRERRAVLRREIEVLRRAVFDSGADHALHLFADGVLRMLVGRSVGAPLSVLLFRPRYPFAAPGHRRRRAREWVEGFAYDAVVTAWRHGREANAVLTLDPLAATRWSRRRGAPVLALTEPSIRSTSRPHDDRRGAALVGALADRKGIHYAVEALEHDGQNLRLVLAGILYAAYEPTFRGLVGRLRSAGVDVEVRVGFLAEPDYLDVLAGARAVLLPYVGHIGMSRVLVEAASVRTPVVAHEEGLVGHLVRTHSLGLTVDCRDPRAFAAAIHELVDDPDAVSHFDRALEAFAAQHSPERFEAAVRAPFEQGPSVRRRTRMPGCA
jgi:glycosyltransferase involved in cell wall biosynthesis